jgi:hypothetical protein
LSRSARSRSLHRRSPTRAPARQDPITYYLSLGDSLAAGGQPIGGPPFGELPPGGYNQSYANQLHRALLPDHPGLHLAKLGCGGSSALTVLNGASWCPYENGTQLAEAVAFLQAHQGTWS